MTALSIAIKVREIVNSRKSILKCFLDDLGRFRIGLKSDDGKAYDSVGCPITLLIWESRNFQGPILCDEVYLVALESISVSKDLAKEVARISDNLADNPGQVFDIFIGLV